MRGLLELFTGVAAAAPAERRPQPYGRGTGRPAYETVQRQRATTKRARAARRINRGRR